jgi:type I restriction enzyme S subunit
MTGIGHHGTKESSGRPLPGGWRWVKLQELKADNDGFADGPFGSNLKTEHYVFAGARVVRLQNIGRGVFLDADKAFISMEHFVGLQRHSVRPGDVVVAALGDGARPAGRACVIPRDFGPGLVKADCFRLRLPANVIHTAYLVAYLNSPEHLRGMAEIMRGATRPRLTLDSLRNAMIPLPPFHEQQRIAAILNEQMAAVERARAAAEAQLEAAKALPAAYIQHSFAVGGRQRISLEDCLEEVSGGVGSDWSSFRLVGATRSGIAPAKENLGKRPERYKVVAPGTIFYNPMRILLGSIAMIDEGEEAGITSPDYVVFKTREGRLSARWFYHWLRSKSGEVLIRSLARGAVRERMLFRRLVRGEIELPPWNAQTEAAERMRDARHLEEMIQQHLSPINTLPAALLRRAFSGQL